MWEIRYIFVRNYYPAIISPCFLETLWSIWWVHSLLMCFFHLQGIPILWKVLNYSNPGYSWAHEAKARISLEHPLSEERTFGQVDLWLRHSHARLLYFCLASCTVTLFDVQKVAPKELPAPRVELGNWGQVLLNLCKYFNPGIPGVLYHCGV